MSQQGQVTFAECTALHLGHPKSDIGAETKITTEACKIKTMFLL